MCVYGSLNNFHEFIYFLLKMSTTYIDLSRFQSINTLRIRIQGAERYFFVCAASVTSSKSKDKFFFTLITRQHPV